MKNLLLFCLLFAGLAANAQSIEDLDAKNGFRDATFGNSITKMKGLVAVATEGSDKCYRRTSDVLKISNAPLRSIEYCFYKGVLASITVTYTTEETREKLLQSLQIAYGLGLDSTDYKPSITGNFWRGKVVSMLLSNDASGAGGNLLINSELVSELKRKDHEAAYKKRAGGL